MSTPAELPHDSISVLDHGFVRLDGAMADDLSVVNGARVSFARRRLEMTESEEGLIRFLMRERHGCYDDATDVLTSEGWKPWPVVTGDELFATRTIDGSLRYEPALRLVRKEYRGHMIGFKGMSIDMLVTPDHRVLVAETTTRQGRLHPTFRLRPAHSVLWKSHRHTTAAHWRGQSQEFITYDGTKIPLAPLLGLLGLFIGDGSLSRRSNCLVFNIHKEREIRFLETITHRAGLELRRWTHAYAVQVGPELRELFAACYDGAREKVIPPQALTYCRGLLYELWLGLLASDGSTQERRLGDRETYATTSRRLADQVQELALKLGRSASIRQWKDVPGDGHYGRKPRYRVTMYNERNLNPGLCRTREEAEHHMGVESYDGLIHCVEVPSHTLYVRRNGYAAWSGNTPFEHNAFRFHVRCPLFVAREWFRHRMGSFNEFSMRYAKATDDFYVPEADDVRTQVGKPGAYSFEPVDDELAETTREELRAVYDHAYATYERLVEAGVARELARAVIPVGAYTEFYWTINARSLMNFVSLRAAETAQREIRRYADAVEAFFAEQMPVTHAAFVANGRKSP